MQWNDEQTGELPFFGIFIYALPHAELALPNGSILQAYHGNIAMYIPDVSPFWPCTPPHLSSGKTELHITTSVSSTVPDNRVGNQLMPESIGVYTVTAHERHGIPVIILERGGNVYYRRVSRIRYFEQHPIVGFMPAGDDAYIATNALKPLQDIRLLFIIHETADEGEIGD